MVGGVGGIGFCLSVVFILTASCPLISQEGWHVDNDEDGPCLLRAMITVVVMALLVVLCLFAANDYVGRDDDDDDVVVVDDDDDKTQGW